MDREAAIRDMMQSMSQGKASEVQDKFNSLMMDRANAAVSDTNKNLQKAYSKIQIYKRWG